MGVPAFKTPEIASYWDKLHPELRGLIRNLDDWMFDVGLERMTVTETYRNPDEQQRIYTPEFLAQGFSPQEAARLARNKFTWHAHLSAVDFRHSIRPYTDEGHARINARLKELCRPRENWELLLHAVGSGLHHHVARRQVPPKEGAV